MKTRPYSLAGKKAEYQGIFEKTNETSETDRAQRERVEPKQRKMEPNSPKREKRRRNYSEFFKWGNQELQKSVNFRFVYFEEVIKRQNCREMQNF